MLRALGGSVRRALAQQHVYSQACASRAVTSSSAAQGGGPEEPLQQQQHTQHTPTVFDILVNINVVDLEGKRRSVRGVVGQTLSQVLVEAGYPKVSSGNRGDDT